jgi:beclin 1
LYSFQYFSSSSSKVENLNTKPENVDDAALDDELEHLKAEEEALRQQLEVVEKERMKLTEQIEDEKKVSQTLDEEEEKYWKEYNEYKRQVLALEDEHRSVENQLKYQKNLNPPDPYKGNSFDLSVNDSIYE